MSRYAQWTPNKIRQVADNWDYPLKVLQAIMDVPGVGPKYAMTFVWSGVSSWKEIHAALTDYDWHDSEGDHFRHLWRQRVVTQRVIELCQDKMAKDTQLDLGITEPLAVMMSVQ